MKKLIWIFFLLIIVKAVYEQIFKIHIVNIFVSIGYFLIIAGIGCVLTLIAIIIKRK